jgi:hypothetical protein
MVCQPDREFDVLMRTRLQAGHNYLIADGIVYSIYAWADGSHYDRMMWTPSDLHYWTHYKDAAADRYARTLFRA